MRQGRGKVSLDHEKEEPAGWGRGDRHECEEERRRAARIGPVGEERTEEERREAHRRRRELASCSLADIEMGNWENIWQKGTENVFAQR
ncbi:hypothetical protein PR202_gb08796 [Eleusine coracana subsp. coracana]|uniref:Uncharacterized protein n=1 Tax=Eleusine coracana subsp. coracana TaxID=191504 RepID=A0AAV5ED56_ELECO|nr:hypothetical protein PR202_gb08796 [Eleusine coracana subsp. coracana]